VTRIYLLLTIAALALLAFEGVRQATKPRPIASGPPPLSAPPLTLNPAPRTAPQSPEATAGAATDSAFSAPPRLTDITHAVGLDFVQTIGPLGTYFMPEINGSGAALWDYDNDGKLDILLVNLGRSPRAERDFPPGTNLAHRLYRQEPDGTFSDQTLAVGLADTRWSDTVQLGIGCAVGDVNNDGFPDLYLTNYGPDQLFINRGGQSFEDQTRAADLGCPLWGTAAAFVDLDRDGWLDLVVVNYSADPEFQHSIACGFTSGEVSYCGPHKFQPTIDRIYRNAGAAGLQNGVPQFIDITDSAGLGATTTYGLGLAVADFDGDAWPDLFIASDMRENRLWMNNCDGTFREEAAPRGVAVSGEGMMQGSMGVAVADIDHDGDFDLVVTNLVTEGATLYLNDGTGVFVDASRSTQVAQGSVRHTGWGVAVIDLDLDGEFDLPIVNGFVVPGGSIFPPHGEDQFQQRRTEVVSDQAFLAPYFDRNILLMNQGGLRFVAANRLLEPFHQPHSSTRGLVYGDIDGDGDLDLLTTSVGGSARLYRNDFPRRGHWLSVACRLANPARDALGAVVRIRAGTHHRMAQIAPSSSYLASHQPLAHFGLGTLDRIDLIEVLWPDGSLEHFPGGTVNQQRILNQGQGRGAGQGITATGSPSIFTPENLTFTRQAAP
jgi:enediyne biosynthesis protein E4